MPSRHPPGVDTEPPDDDVVLGALGGKLPLSAAQRRFEAATTGPSNRTFEVLKSHCGVQSPRFHAPSNRTFEVLKCGLASLISSFGGLPIAPLRY